MIRAERRSSVIFYIGAALAARSQGTFPPAKSVVFAGCSCLLARHWPRGVGVLFRRQKAWFLAAGLAVV
jgi:hypothetical protein